MKIFKDLFGIINVEESNTQVVLGGVRTYQLSADIQKTWSTSKIESYMFSDMSRSSIKFAKFFAPDVHYMLQTIGSNPKAKNVSRSTINAAIHAMETQSWLKQITEPVQSRLNRNALSMFSKKPLPHQDEFFKIYDERTQQYNLTGYLLSAAAGSGKAQPLSALVKTPFGWVPMGSIREGDVVSAWDGSPTQVTGVYPQGVKEIYEFTFRDGRATRACAEHLWRVYDSAGAAQGQVLNTQALLALKKQGKRVYVDLVRPEVGVDLPSLTDPYGFGKNLATNPLGDDGYVPADYYRASAAQRMAIIQGALDVCGAVNNEEGSIHFSTSSLLVATGLQKLVWSIGGYAKILNHSTAMAYTPGKGLFVMDIRLSDLRDLFSDPTRQATVRVDRATPLLLEMIDIQPCGSEEAQCISIEHPDHLYVTDNYLVTHNTLTCLMLAEMLSADQVIMIVPKNSLHKVWSRHLSEEYKTPQPHWIADSGQPYKGEKYLVAHYEALEKVLEIVRSRRKQNAFVVLDESHNMNEMTSARTPRFIELCKVAGAKNVIWSSGTPLKALGYEVIPLLRTIDPFFTPNVEERFKKIFGREAKRALDILRNRMGIISYKVDKLTVVDNKPVTNEIRVKIPTGKKYELESVSADMTAFITTRVKYYKDNFKDFERIYDEALEIHANGLRTRQDVEDFDTYKSYIKMIRKGYDPKLMVNEAKYCNQYELKRIMPSIPQQMRPQFKNCRAVIKYTMLKVMGEALGSILGKARVNCHVDMLPYIDFDKIIQASEKKVVIFTSYVEVVQELGQMLKKLKYNPLLVYGETNKDLTGIITQFEKDPKANPIIATYKSLSTAVPLITANTEIFLNQPWRDSDLTQARARVDRLGQDTQVFFFNVFLDTGEAPNVSTRSKDILEWSREQVTAIMGESYGGDVAAVLATAGEYTTESLVDMEFNEVTQIALEYYHEHYEGYSVT